MKKIYLLLVSSALLASARLQAQQNMTLYNMELLSSRSSMNPAFMNHGKININLPGISNTYVSHINSAFKYNDLVRRSDDDSLYIDIPNMIGKLKAGNFMSFGLETDLLSFGFRVKKTYIGVNATEKIQARFSYPKELIEFLYEGNAASMGRVMDLSFGLDVMHYREYGLTIAHNFSRQVTLGIKVKYLYGMENIHTAKSSLSVYTDPETYAITAKSNINIQTSGINKGGTGEEFDLMKYAFSKQNTGYGLDLGINYKLNEKFIVSGSLNDLGFITWKSNTTSYSSTNPDAEFTYNGIDINQYDTDSTNYSDAMHNMLDSLSDQLHIDTLYNSYSTFLPAQVYIGGNYLLNEKNNIGLLIYNQFHNKKLHPAVTASFNTIVGKWLNLALSYTVTNNTYNNLGFGFAINDYDVQIFAVSDNVIGLIFPANTKNVNIRAGINLKIGTPGRKSSF
jgi:hypothetical protein